ncbi:MAG: hypothetical protein ACQ5SW_13580, partial [Sphaerochaetaceae bacterium]
MGRKDIQSWTIIMLALLVSGICLSSVGRLHIDSSTDAFIPKDHQVVETNEQIEERFGSLDSVVVSLYAPHSILTKPYLELLASLTKQIE